MKYFVKSDWNGFFGLFTNNLTNVLVMATLLSVVVGMPNNIVYGRIIPAVGLSILLASIYYSYMAARLARRENRDDVTALPAGTSVPHMFLIVFLIIGPVYWATDDPYIAWSAGLVWALFEGLVELLGSFIGARVRKILPRAAMLGSLAGVSITYIALEPAFSIFALPYIGMVTLAIVLLGWVGKAKMPFNIPTGLIAIIVGVILGWSTGHMSIGPLLESIRETGIGFPVPSFLRFADGFEFAVPFLVSAVPLGIYNFFETIDNCESASAAGDHYSTNEAMVADGVTSVIGSVFGNPFPTAVFIGHPGWKEAGARIGYSFAGGIAIFLMSIFGMISVLLNVIPVEAVLPILLYIGLVITTQAFTSVPARYAPAVVLAIVPWLADWTRNAVDTALSAAGTNASEVGTSAIEAAGLQYEGMALLGAGSILVGIVLATVAAFVVDRRFLGAAVASVLGACATFFGIIHSQGLTLNANPGIAAGYTGMALVFVFFHFTARRSAENTQNSGKGD